MRRLLVWLSWRSHRATPKITPPASCPEEKKGFNHFLSCIFFSSLWWNLGEDQSHLKCLIFKRDGSMNIKTNLWLSIFKGFLIWWKERVLCHQRFFLCLSSPAMRQWIVRCPLREVMRGHPDTLVTYSPVHVLTALFKANSRTLLFNFILLDLSSTLYLINQKISW